MPRKKKLANHVLLQHGNTTYAQKAQEDIQRIKMEKQKKKGSRKQQGKRGGREKGCQTQKRNRRFEKDHKKNERGSRLTGRGAKTARARK